MSVDFADVVHQHHDEIFRYLWRLQLSRHEVDADANAADLTQETFQRAFEAYGRLQPDSNVRAWLYKIATNCARTDWRRSQGRLPVQLDLETVNSPQPDPEQRLVIDEGQQRMLAALEALPFKQRSAVSLRHLQDMSYEAIGKILDCSNESARANVYQGLRQLRQALAQEKTP